MEGAVIRTSNLSYRLGDHVILDKIDMEVHPGEFIGIIGPNGAGKTTLLRLLLGLIRPTGGEVAVLGTPPSALGIKREFIGYMPQRPQVSRHFPLSVLDVVAMGLATAASLGKPLRREQYEKARESLQKVGMLAAEHLPFAGLSGGQQQLVFLARALVKKPALLFLDEPGAGLDLPARTGLWSC